ncbi:MAG TPA: EscU/YscU/HrcU family type III secretion system export apparatus switch protein [Pirellulales bacterium]|nr:EscU/YscU/HrcU family type III secretion system export apparatus switch protein [Pirellulales bacterium]
MADNEATFEATPHRRELARQQGRFARSASLTAVASLVGSLGILWWFAEPLAVGIGRLTADQLSSAAWLRIDDGSGERVENALHELTPTLCLPLISIALWCVLVQVAQIGLRIYSDRLMPNLERIDPLAGIRRILSWNQATSVGFAVFKLLAVAAAAYWIVRCELATILALPTQDLAGASLYLTERLPWAIAKLVAALIPVGAIDYGLQWWQRERDLRMTPEELREEMRNLQAGGTILARRRGKMIQRGKPTTDRATPVARL